MVADKPVNITSFSGRAHQLNPCFIDVVSGYFNQFFSKYIFKIRV